MTKRASIRATFVAGLVFVGITDAFAVSGRFKILEVGNTALVEQLTKGASKHFKQPIVFKISNLPSSFSAPRLHSMLIHQLREGNSPVSEITAPGSEIVAVTNVSGFLKAIASLQKKNHFVGISYRDVDRVVKAAEEVGEKIGEEELVEVRID